MSGGRLQPLRPLAEVAIRFNRRTYRFVCEDSDRERFDEIANYLMSKLESLLREHGDAGDERLILMAALNLADELFDARSDIDDLLDGEPQEAKSLRA